MTNKLIKDLRRMRDVQGRDGNWNYDLYMLGMYNGLEAALCIFENRDPEYRIEPDKWLADIKTDHLILATEAG